MQIILQIKAKYKNFGLFFYKKLLTYLVNIKLTKISFNQYSRSFVLALLISMPNIAHATNAITEFSGPLERVVGTLTGPVGMWISILAMALCGVYYVMNKDDISGTFKQVVSTVFAITCIASATTVVNNVFSFTGALI